MYGTKITRGTVGIGGVVCCTRFFPWGGRAEKPNTSVNGHPGEVAVIEREGHAYAEIEGTSANDQCLAELQRKSDRADIPGAAGPASATTQPFSVRLHQGLIRAGIEEWP